MKIKWGSIVVNGSGKLGGHVYAKNRGGHYVRTLARASNPQTSAQQKTRSQFTVLSQGWGSLTENQRSSWNDATNQFTRTDQFGDIRQLSGKNLYLSLNKERAIIGLGPLLVAPEPAPISICVVENVLFDISQADINIQGSFIESAKYVVVATERVTNGTSFVKNKLRIIYVGEGSSAGTFIPGAGQIYNSYVGKFGLPVDNDKVFIGAYSVNSSGQKSPISKLAVIVRA